MAVHVQALNFCLLAFPASFLLISPQELIIQKSFLLLQRSDNSERGCAVVDNNREIFII